jgi:hypothetical protein
LIVSTTVVGMPSGKPLYGFQRSVPKQLRRPDIEHDLVVIPGIIKRRDIDLSPPVAEWPLCARFDVEATSRIDVNLPLVMAMQTARFVLVIGDRTGGRALRRRAHAGMS